MHCGTRGHHGSSCGCGCGTRGHHGGSCGCGCGGHSFRRRFVTKEERIAQLEEYLDSLQKETQAVQERIAKMKEK